MTLLAFALSSIGFFSLGAAFILNIQEAAEFTLDWRKVGGIGAGLVAIAAILWIVA